MNGTRAIIPWHLSFCAETTNPSFLFPKSRVNMEGLALFAPYRYDRHHDNVARQFLTGKLSNISRIGDFQGARRHPFLRAATRTLDGMIMHEHQFYCLSDAWWDQQLSYYPALSRLRECIADDSRTTLDLAYQAIPATALSMVLQLVAENLKHVTTVDLGGNWLGDDGCATLAGPLARLTGVTTLRLHHNNIGCTGIYHMFQVFRQLQIETLHLHRNQIGDDGATVLAVALPSTIRTLTLWGNEIGPRGCSALANCVRRLPHLDLISLGYNHVGYAGIQCLAPALVESTVRAVDLGRCDLGADSAEELLDMIVSEHIESIALWGNDLDKRVAKAVRFRLSASRNTQFIDISRNHLPFRWVRRMERDRSRWGVQIKVGHQSGQKAMRGMAGRAVLKITRKPQSAAHPPA